MYLVICHLCTYNVASTISDPWHDLYTRTKGMAVYSCIVATRGIYMIDCTWMGDGNNIQPVPEALNIVISSHEHRGVKSISLL